MPDILSILQNVIAQFVAIIPNFLGAIIVFIIGWIISKIVYKIVKNVLASIGIDKIGEQLNEIELISKANVKILISEIVAKILYYILMLIFTIAATEILGMAAISDLMSSILNYFPRLLSALIVLVIGILLAEFVKNIVATACKSLGIPAGNFIANFVFYFLFLTVGMSALAQAQIDTGFITSNLSIILAGIVAAFAIGYGFASRDLMANFLASFYGKQKIQIGDIIAIEGQKGVVIEIDSNSLTLQGEGKKIIIPLSKLTTEKVEIHDHDA